MTYHKPWIYKPSKAMMIFIVGQNPGKSRVKVKRAFVGNRTGDYVLKLLKYLKFENVYLTNACNNSTMTKYWMREGRLNLWFDIMRMKPKIVVTLGKIAHEQVSKLELHGFDHYKLVHPSCFLRFNKKGERDVFESMLEYFRRQQQDDKR